MSCSSKEGRCVSRVFGELWVEILGEKNDGVLSLTSLGVGEENLF